MNTPQTPYPPDPPVLSRAPSYAPMPGARARRPFSFWFAILLLLMLLASLVANAVLVAVIGASRGLDAAERKLEEQVVEAAGAADKKIVLLPLEGVITSDETASLFGVTENLPAKIDAHLDQATLDRDVAAIVLAVNSPGGSVTASDKIWARIERFKADRPDVKVVAYFDEVSASGGYYVSAGAHRIVAHPTCLTGSIGVIMSGYNVAELLTKLGVSPVVIKSSKSNLKDIMSSSRPMTEEERAILQSIIDESYERFVDVIAKGRTGLSREAVVAAATGTVYTAAQAKAKGLVDELGDLDAACAAAKKLAGLASAQVVRYASPPGLLALLNGPGYRAGAPSGELVLRVDPLAAADALRPRLFYLGGGGLR